MKTQAASVNAEKNPHSMRDDSPTKNLATIYDVRLRDVLVTHSRSTR